MHIDAEIEDEAGAAQPAQGVDEGRRSKSAGRLVLHEEAHAFEQAPLALEPRRPPRHACRPERQRRPRHDPEHLVTALRQRRHERELLERPLQRRQELIVRPRYRRRRVLCAAVAVHRRRCRRYHRRRERVHAVSLDEDEAA